MTPRGRPSRTRRAKKEHREESANYSGVDRYRETERERERERKRERKRVGESTEGIIALCHAAEQIKLPSSKFDRKEGIARLADGSS